MLIIHKFLKIHDKVILIHSENPIYALFKLQNCSLQVRYSLEYLSLPIYDMYANITCQYHLPDNLMTFKVTPAALLSVLHLLLTYCGKVIPGLCSKQQPHQ